MANSDSLFRGIGSYRSSEFAGLSAKFPSCPECTCQNLSPLRTPVIGTCIEVCYVLESSITMYKSPIGGVGVGKEWARRAGWVWDNEEEKQKRQGGPKVRPLARLLGCWTVRNG